MLKLMDFNFLREKSKWVRKETLRIHKTAQGIRLASALSCVEILTVTHYGKILNFYPNDIYNESRDRFILSKAHGTVSYYPILADLGYFDKKYLDMVGKAGSILGDIPDCSIPGYETVNGSLGHGLNVACGIAIGLKKKNRREKVYVLSGDGELYEGSVWEAIMFAGHHNLNNIVLIIDNNKICMLDYCNKVINLEPISEKFRVFGWKDFSCDGHNVEEFYKTMLSVKNDWSDKPKVVIADTIKGKGVPRLETDSLCHIKAISSQEIDDIISQM